MTFSGYKVTSETKFSVLEGQATFQVSEDEDGNQIISVCDMTGPKASVTIPGYLRRIQKFVEDELKLTPRAISEILEVDGDVR
ncbi:hypothetical protein [Hyphococcus sp.]|uniref:hypothetical protein n=1 Tax=Hyphococcus sp. TaxID=2038636 RepID=UPI0035C710AF